MIKCRLININQALHLSKHTDQKYVITATQFYRDEAKKFPNEELVGVFRMDPIITPTKEFNDFIIMKFHTPSISPTPELLSLEYDIIEDFLRDWEILGVYDIFDNPEQLNPKHNLEENWRERELNLALRIYDRDNIIDI